MEIRQIHYFLTLVKHLNYTSAAMELNISQSTLSRQITAMEAELNVLLFLRDNRNVVLTNCGEYLSVELHKLYTNYSVIIENGQKIFQGFSGTLTFGVLHEITLKGKLQDALDRHLKAYPNHTLDMARGSFRNLTDGILDLSYDFIITFLFDISRIRELRYKVIEKQEDGILISAKNRLSKRKVFHPPDFKDTTFILISKDESPYLMERVISYCQKYGFYPKIKIAPNLDTAMLWVEAGIGLAFSYADSVASYNPAMAFIPFPKTDTIPESQRVLAWNPGNQNPAIKLFVDSFKNI